MLYRIIRKWIPNVRPQGQPEAWDATVYEGLRQIAQALLTIPTEKYSDLLVEAAEAKFSEETWNSCGDEIPAFVTKCLNMGYSDLRNALREIKASQERLTPIHATTVSMIDLGPYVGDALCICTDKYEDELNKLCELTTNACLFATQIKLLEVVDRWSKPQTD